MPISWNEIKQRAIQFGKEWQTETREKAEAQTFWNEFFNVFGIRRRTVASFEEPVRGIKNAYGFIDLFWKGVLLAEHKSSGKDFTKAESQAFQYIQDLKNEGRDEEIPRYVILSDFQRIALFDLEADESSATARFAISLNEFHRHIQKFAFIAGYTTHRFDREDPINIHAAERMGALHDTLEDSNYTGHALERMLVRILFCLFADDTGIFEPQTFNNILEQTRPDGSDVGPLLATIFDVLETPADKRQRNLEENLAALPYVNGGLFEERLPIAHFNSQMREVLLNASHFDWSRISPAIFGALFQSIMQPRQRRQIGAHYTSERDIMKVIRPLFLDSLWAEFERIRNNRRLLERFHEKLASLRFLDPACGCGNFLVITYRELRLLEIEVLQALHGNSREAQQQFTEIWHMSRIDVDQMYGIEIEEWPARIAEVAMWLVDHQMNVRLSEAFGQYFVRLPLRKSPHIVQGNALRLQWEKILPPQECSYILGNPPFVGKKEQNDEQKYDHDLIWDKIPGTGILDYVTCWYVKAGEYTKGTKISCAFVSTNSITQGEQVGVLWTRLFNEFNFKIHFAHTTFAWTSEARGAAHVHVVIIGFGSFDVNQKNIYIYEDLRTEPTATPARNINPYLADAPDVVVTTRSTPLCNVRAINYGSMMIDKDRKAGTEQGLIIDDAERTALIRECPGIRSYIRHIYGGEEYINGTHRWCLWLDGAPTALLRTCDRLRQRIDGVRRYRLRSGREATRNLADTPYLFGEIRQPNTDYLLIPKVSSENRLYVPIGFLPPKIIASGSTLVMPDATHYEFGILTSAMHMMWLKTVGGRLESRLQYSSTIVYNNFPWPKDVAETKRNKVKDSAKKVLDTRQVHLAKRLTLADLYDPLTMPRDLLKAHQALDRAVELCYRPQPFANDRQRVEFLFQLYEQYQAPLLAEASKKRRGSRK